MAHAIRMPALGQSRDEMKLVQWFKAVGTHVDEGEPLFEAESDKTTLEVEAAATGTLLQVACQPGDIVASGTVIAWLGEPGEVLPSASAPPSKAAASSSSAGAVETRAPSPGGRGPSPDGRVQATPAARTLAREHRVELSGLVGTGPEGRIERRDVQEVIDKQGSAPEAQGEEPVPPHRQVIAQRLARAAQVPHFSISKTVDATAMRRLAAEVEGLTITHLLLQAVSAALLEHPALDRTWNETGPFYRRLGRGDVGVAVVAGDNLIVARVPCPANLSLEELALTVRRATAMAREGRLVQEFSGPVAVTVSNLGMFGVDRFEAVIDPDQCAILAAGQIQDRPGVVDGTVRPVAQLDLTLSVDHRVADGAEAAAFLSAISDRLERPDRSQI
ncbi:MAG TPA: dihydrolipoamide acetyltransferase family protein [Acidimicrobiales bacterium]|nr:dihydrolipoamide acetyltransferase family protein [Acidimicrobiales bacterium]